MQPMPQQAYLAALEWHLDMGANEAILEEAQDHLQRPVAAPPPSVAGTSLPVADPPALAGHTPQAETAALAGTQALKQQATELAAAANTLEDLAAAIQNFEGLDIKKTATNFVFADGNPRARVMLVGEAPGADEDRQGTPFVGVSGQLLDKILACIGLDRRAEDPAHSIYISNVLNWRPPGNRTPTPQEMEIALPFIEKHIALKNPECLILCGGVAATTLLHSKESISRLRGTRHIFMPQTLQTDRGIPAIATYHPSYLLRTPSQKAKVWQDMLFLQKMLEEV
ncbi:MAG: uracil-DNA glycosylase [Rhodospirillales bacterium]|nr:uracil-DNA glycosylase [Rhodospirillales bacterium]